MRILVALALALAVQQAPPRDTPAPAPPATGTGIIKGRVVTPEGTPVRRADVSIGGGPGASSVSIQTDARGHYEARNLRPGFYSVYAQPTSTQGQFLPPLPTPPMPDGSPRRVALAEGQTIEWFDIVFRRAAAIVGRVVDELGEPVSGVYMSVHRLGDRPGSTNAGSQSTDEFGRYRIFRLPPGEYEVVARPSTIPSGVRGAQIGFLETYYPGTPSREEARRLTVREGRETSAADLVLATGRMLTVKGAVVDAKGNSAPPATMIALDREWGGMSTSVDSQGRFSFQPQPPGHYTLSARLLSENRELTVEYGSVPLTLADEDADVIVPMKPTVTITGRVSLEDAGVEIRPGSLRISVQTRKGRLGAPRQLFFSPAVVKPDLTFTLTGLAGELLLRLSGEAGARATIKGVFLGEEDITDVPREFRTEDSGRLRVVVGNRVSLLAGSVTDEKNAPVRSGAVVAFSEDKTFWFADSTRVRATALGRDGTYRLPILRAGRYHLVALPVGVPWDWSSIDPALLERYLPQATSVVVGEDDQRQVDLKIATIPDGGY